MLHFARRFLILSMLAGIAPLVSGQTAPVKVRQVVIRAPSLDVATAALANPDDKDFADTLWRWVQEGKAKVASDVNGLAVGDQPVEVKEGEEVKQVSVRDQDFENMILEPNQWENRLVGTLMKIGMPEHTKDNLGERLKEWEAAYSPRQPLVVKWPVVWPLNKVPRVAWLDEQDFFTETIRCRVSLESRGARVLGMVPVADRLEPGSANVAQTDVFLSELAAFYADHPAAEKKSAPDEKPTVRLLLVGFGVDEAKAHELLESRRNTSDVTLLNRLLELVGTGGASLKFSCSQHLPLHGQGFMESGRGHMVPTEMPTIPSAWEERNIGLRIESSYSAPGIITLAMEQHPSLPPRQVWKCALDAPEMEMWQPQFLVQSVSAGICASHEGVRLTGAMPAPDLAGSAEGMPGEMLLLFAKVDEARQSVPSAAVQSVQSPTAIEVEAVIFDVPVSWEKAAGNFGDEVDEEARYNKLMGEVKTGRVKVLARVHVTTANLSRAGVSSLKEVLHVTEGNPDYMEIPGRYRPTALDMLPTGVAWEVDPAFSTLDQKGEINLSQILKYSVKAPEEPTLEQMISFTAANNDLDLPAAQIFQEEWSGQFKLQDGKVQLAGVRHPFGGDGDRVHVAYIRATILK